MARAAIVAEGDVTEFEFGTENAADVLERIAETRAEIETDATSEAALRLKADKGDLEAAEIAASMQALVWNNRSLSSPEALQQPWLDTRRIAYRPWMDQASDASMVRPHFPESLDTGCHDRCYLPVAT